ncbi:MAG: type II toxin-antitoxin system HicA family toxin [Bacteroidota bacterium]
MSRQEKLLNRLLSIPKDLTWEELVKVLAFYGYEEHTGGKTGGSRRKFVDSKMNVIMLHKPHPANIVKPYAVRQVISDLKEAGYLQDE